MKAASQLLKLPYYPAKIVSLKQKPKVFSFTITKPNWSWLLGIICLFLFISLAHSYDISLLYSSPDQNINFFLVWILYSILIYFIGRIGIYKIGIREERKKNRSYSVDRTQKNEHISTLEKILISQRKFLDSDLTLESIALEMQISKGHLSRVINNNLRMSFTDYVNKLRVEEAKSHLKNSEFSNYTLVAIGLEAGFNSKSTFNSAFKKIAGVTPSEFKNAHLN
jgi:AraC-like DNA-binding protein